MYYYRVITLFSDVRLAEFLLFHLLALLSVKCALKHSGKHTILTGTLFFPRLLPLTSLQRKRKKVQFHGSTG